MTSVAVPEHRDRPSPLAVGVAIWLASEVMFFGGLFAAYFALKADNDPNWPMGDARLEVVRSAVFTVVLVASSVTMHYAVKDAEEGRRSRSLALLVLTVLLGATFLTNQVLEYRTLDFSLDTDAYGTIYYLLTGFHALHVAVGLGALALVAWVVFSHVSRMPRAETLRATSYYWHFVDVVWVGLFVVVYLIQ